MKRIPDKTGEYPFKLWFDRGEIDELCADHIKNSGVVEPPVPIEVFVEKYIKADFDTLVRLGHDQGEPIIGKTTFKRDGHILIEIDESLTLKADEDTEYGRFNFTVAHEAFHALYHRELFLPSVGQLEFDAFKQDASIRCLNRDIGFSGNIYSWIEYQANLGAAAFLMPSYLFLPKFQAERNAYGIYDNLALTAKQEILNSVICYLSQIFKASKEAVRIRLQHLGCLPNMAQPELYSSSDFESAGEILKRMRK